MITIRHNLMFTMLGEKIAQAVKNAASASGTHPSETI